MSFEMLAPEASGTPCPRRKLGTLPHLSCSVSGELGEGRRVCWEGSWREQEGQVLVPLQPTPLSPMLDLELFKET